MEPLTASWGYIEPAWKQKRMRSSWCWELPLPIGIPLPKAAQRAIGTLVSPLKVHFGSKIIVPNKTIETWFLSLEYSKMSNEWKFWCDSVSECEWCQVSQFNGAKRLAPLGMQALLVGDWLHLGRSKDLEPTNCSWTENILGNVLLVAHSTWKSVTKGPISLALLTIGAGAFPLSCSSSLATVHYKAPVSLPM